MKRQWWYGLLLLVAFVALGSYYLNTRGGSKRIKRTRVLPGSSLIDVNDTGVAQTKKSGLNGTPEKIRWGRNPFLTPEEEATGGRPGTKGLDVKTIIVGDSKSVATLGGFTVSVGENIGDERVVEIRQDAVVLERNGRRRIIRATELHRISAEIKGSKKNGEMAEDNGNRENGTKEVK